MKADSSDRAESHANLTELLLGTPVHKDRIPCKSETCKAHLTHLSCYDNLSFYAAAHIECFQKSYEIMLAISL